MPRKAVSHHETRSANSSGACEGADCSQTDLYIRGRGEEAGREARAIDAVDRRGGAGDDLLLLEPRHHLGLLHPRDVEADQARRDLTGERGEELDVLHPRQPAPALLVELVDALRDPRLADA